MALLFHDDTGFDRQFIGCEPQCFACRRFGHTVDLKKDPARAHRKYIMVHCTFTASQRLLRCLQGDRLIGEYPDPQSAGTLEEVRDGLTARLYLARRKPRRLKRLQAELSVRELKAARLNLALA